MTGDRVVRGTARARPAVLLPAAFAVLVLAVSAPSALGGMPSAQAAEAPVPATDAPVPATGAPVPAAAADGCDFGIAPCVSGTTLPDVTVSTPSGTSSLPAVAQETAEAARTVLHETFGWWLKTPSVRIEAGGVLELQAVMLGLAAVVMTLLVIVQGVRMMTTRRGMPFAELIRGSFVAAVVVAAGVALIDSALIAADKLAAAIVGVSFASSDELVRRMTDVMLGDGVKGQSPTLVLMFSLIVLLVGLVQAVLLFLRQTVVPMLGIILPIAGVGQAGPPATQLWLPKVLNVLFAIVLYKPVVAVVLSVGFVELTSGTTLLDAIRGAVTLVVAVIAFPALLRMLAPLSRTLAVRSGDGLAVLGAAGGFAASFARRGAGTPGDTTAVQHAAFMQAVGSSVGAGRNGGSPHTILGPDGVPDPRGPGGADGTSDRRGAPVVGQAVAAGAGPLPAAGCAPATGDRAAEVPVTLDVAVTSVVRLGDKVSEGTAHVQ